MRVITFDLDFSGRPVIDLFLMPSTALGEVPAIFAEPETRSSVRALVDSGASRTLVRRSLIESLNLLESGETELHTVSTGRFPVTAPTYKIRIYVQRVAGDLLASDLEVVEAEDLSGLKVDMLLGRDVLDRCLLVYNGPEKTLTIAFEPPTPDE